MSDGYCEAYEGVSGGWLVVMCQRWSKASSSREADLYTLQTAIVVVATITAASELDVTLRMTETHPPQARATKPEATTGQP